MDEASLAALRQSAMAALASGAAMPGTDYDGVWPEHVETVRAFNAVGSQWRVVSIGGGGFVPAWPMFVGLDYAAVRAGLICEGIEITPGLWRGIRVMESAACIALNEAS